MRVRTDDEVYRVDAVWLGPPKATFPWRARYVAWGVGIVVFFVTLGVEHAIGFRFGFFTAAWALVITIGVTRFLTRRISHERPLSAVMAMWMGELQSPRERSTPTGGAASATRIRVRVQRPRPKVSSGRAAARGTGQRIAASSPKGASGRRAKPVNGRPVSPGQPGRQQQQQLSWEQPRPAGPPDWERPRPASPPNWERSDQQAIWMAPQPTRQPSTGSPRAAARPKRRGRSARR